MLPRTYAFYRGRVALYALLRALGVGPGDEVVLQAFTCLAVPAAILGVGARPVYADIDPASFNLDPEALEKVLTPRTRVLIVQHTYGAAAPLEPILSLARERGIPVLADCCHVLGSRYRGRPLEDFGHAAFTSYEWGKPLVIGLGGVATVRDAGLASRMDAIYGEFAAPSLKRVALIELQYLAHRLLRRPALFWQVRALYRFLSRRGVVEGSFTPEELSGCVGGDYRLRMAGPARRRLARRLREAARSVALRRRLGEAYAARFRELGIPPPAGTPFSDTVYLRYPLRVRDKARALQEARRRGVELGDWFASPVHPLQEAGLKAAGYRPGSCPQAEAACSEVVTLPVTEGVTPKQVDRSVELVAQFRREGLL